jgi:hypothetical protein
VVFAWHHQESKVKVENHDERGKEQRDPEEEKISTEKAAQLQH